MHDLEDFLLGDNKLPIVAEVCSRSAKVQNTCYLGIQVVSALRQVLIPEGRALRHKAWKR